MSKNWSVDIPWNVVGYEAAFRSVPTLKSPLPGAVSAELPTAEFPVSIVDDALSAKFVALL
jgi:hypothetical protein